MHTCRRKGGGAGKQYGKIKKDWGQLSQKEKENAAHAHHVRAEERQMNNETQDRMLFDSFLSNIKHRHSVVQFH